MNLHSPAFRSHDDNPDRITDREKLKMSRAEVALRRLRQGGRELERYVEEFIELSHQVGWHEASLGAVFVLGLDDETIRCDLPTCSFPLIELINLILYLNGSDFEVEEVQSPIRSHLPVSSQTQRNAPACPKPRTSTYRVNGSNRQPSPKSPVILQSSTAVLSPMRPASSPRSNPPATAQSPVPQAATPEPARKMAAATPASARKMAATPEPPAKMASVPEPPAKMAAKPESPAMITGMNIMDRAIPMEFTASIISPDFPEPPLVPPSLPEPPLVPPSLPKPPLVPPSLPEPSQATAIVPESSQVVAVFPESSQVAATESSQIAAAFPEASQVSESSQVTAVVPELSQVSESRKLQLQLLSQVTSRLSQVTSRLHLLSQVKFLVRLMSQDKVQLALQSRSSVQLALLSRLLLQRALLSRRFIQRSPGLAEP
ncbi:hypothetical protein M9458_050795 [Cirrhinus mrigala]|uniref:Uncharacterized protein n=1 Tax=Cirrhinus mrigala TaxID=683832 RepID=A0ABD0MV39_CIRMR